MTSNSDQRGLPPKPRGLSSPDTLLIGNDSPCNESHRFVFIGGVHRSGTSILHRCLAAHPRVSGFSNTGVEEDEGQLLQSVYPPARVFGGPGRFGFDPRAHMTEKSPLVSLENRRKLLHDWEKYWDMELPVLLEKSPPNIIRMRFLQALFPKARFIVVVRHPVAVALSTAEWKRSRYSTLVNHWATCHEIMIGDLPRVRHVRVVRYEALVACPRETLRSILRFIGVDPDVEPAEPVRGGRNEAYFRRWRTWRRPMRRLDAAATIRAMNSRVRALGYDLEDLSAVLEAGFCRVEVDRESQAN
jgi:Sulfotransferase family